MAKILLVDDDISFRGALMATLEIAGHDITSAENGLEALEVLKENKFDLIISDIQMPKMNGVDLTKEVRKNSQIPIILITGFSQIFETKQAFEIGANDFIPKPFEREDIEEASSI